jgi:Ca-activated chloride channel homolog
MLTLAYPWLLALLVLPLLVRWLVPPYREERRSLVVPFLDRLAQAGGQRLEAGTVVGRAGPLHGIGLTILWGAIVLALARPQIIEPPVTKEVPVRDLLLAVDLSGSMEASDFRDATGMTVNRLTAVKSVLDDFLARRQGDRVGLILFGSAPFVQVPFTEDLKVCRTLLAEARVSMAGPQTAFGDAIGLAVNVFDCSPAQERVLIVLTDGNDTASQVPPVKAAEVAHDKGIVIHTVSVGDPSAVGEDALDVETLKKVAATTGGLYAHAADLKQLQGIYQQLDQLQTRKAQTLTHRPRRDVYWWPLVFGLAVSLLAQTARLAVEHSHGRSLSALTSANQEIEEGGPKRTPGTQQAAVRP